MGHRRPEGRKSRSEVLDSHFETSPLGCESSLVGCSRQCAICRTLDAIELRVSALFSPHASVHAYYCQRKVGRLLYESGNRTYRVCVSDVVLFSSVVVSIPMGVVCAYSRKSCQNGFALK